MSKYFYSLWKNDPNKKIINRNFRQIFFWNPWKNRSYIDSSTSYAIGPRGLLEAKHKRAFPELSGEELSSQWISQADYSMLLPYYHTSTVHHALCCFFRRLKTWQHNAWWQHKAWSVNNSGFSDSQKSDNIKRDDNKTRDNKKRDGLYLSL